MFNATIVGWCISLFLVLLVKPNEYVHAFSTNKSPKSDYNGFVLSEQSKQSSSRRPPPPLNGNEKDNTKQEPTDLSRRAVFDWPFLVVGSAVVTGELLSVALGSLSLSRPPAHEQRVADTIRRALTEAAAATKSTNARVLKVLEVGIGSDLRLVRRGLYNQGIDRLAGTSIKSLEITGIDIQNLPKEETLKDANLLLDQIGQHNGVKTTLNIVQGDIDSKLPFDDGTFDAVICCLTLCSVSDPKTAVKEIQRLIRPSGGTFGYVEHVAVNPDEPYRFLEWQQKALDPLQQLVAENCHLHRYTANTIREVFLQDNKATTIQDDRFLVGNMWPVTSQCCGVIQRMSA